MHLPSWLKNPKNLGLLAAVLLLVGSVLYTSHRNSSGAIQTVPTKVSISQPTSLVAGVQDSTSTTSTSTSRVATTATSTPVITPAQVSQNTVSTSTIEARALLNSGAQLLKSLVNIVCVSGDPSIPSISGSGVIIDPRGIIITAAHVAQLFLLQDYLGTNKVICIIRTGTPARRAYLAEPIYVSPTWVANNPTTLTSSNPQGTGENDFALLAITGTATSTPVPTSFPFMPLATATLAPTDRVAIGSYGAQYLTASQINTSLYPILDFGAIQHEYTFGTNTVDLVSVLGSPASQEGSSGGGIANDQGQIGGIITTSSITGDLQTRSLNAITIGHIRRSYTADTGQSLDAVLQSESLSQLVAGFANESKVLGQKIVTDIGSN